MLKLHAPEAHNVAPRDELGKSASAAAHLAVEEKDPELVKELLRVKLASDALPQLFVAFTEIGEDVPSDIIDLLVDVVATRDISDLEQAMRDYRLDDGTLLMDEVGADEKTDAPRLLELIREKYSEMTQTSDQQLSSLLASSASLHIGMENSAESLRAATQSYLDTLQALERAKEGADDDTYETITNIDKGVRSILGDLSNVLGVVAGAITDNQQILDIADDARRRSRESRKLRKVKKKVVTPPAEITTTDKTSWFRAMQKLVTSGTLLNLEDFKDRKFESLAPNSLKKDAAKVAAIAGLYEFALLRAADPPATGTSFNLREVARMLRVLYVTVTSIQDVDDKVLPASGTTAQAKRGKRLRAIFNTMLGIEYITAFEYYNGLMFTEPAQRLFFEVDREAAFDRGDWYEESDFAVKSLDGMRRDVQDAYESVPWDAPL
jgi:hypothetical protein